MFDLFGKKKILRLSQLFEKCAGMIQQNRIYIMQIEAENQYFRELFKKLGLKEVKSRENWLLKQSEKFTKEQQDRVNQEMAKLQAQAKLQENKSKK